ncbi:MAG: hypothetical protein GY817_09205 [bacterium]|nr:hypothetical protein [bacterium]
MRKIELLENKIKQAIIYIESLKLEKDNYQKKLIDLKLELKAKETEIKQLKLRYSKVDQGLGANEKAKAKLADILRKIEDFELLKLS